MDPYDELKWEIEEQDGVKVGDVLRSFADKQKEYGDDEPDYRCTRVRVGLTLCLAGEEDETTLEYRYEGSIGRASRFPKTRISPKTRIKGAVGFGRIVVLCKTEE